MAVAKTFYPFAGTSTRRQNVPKDPSEEEATTPRNYLRNQDFEARTPKAESFRQFMRRALYAPERGYYSSHITTVGARGDFATTTTLSAQLGKAIAAWLRHEFTIMPGVRTIIEVGGGDGSLMESVLRSLGWWHRVRKRVLMVETSPILKSQQQSRLRGKVKGWYSSLREALEASRGEALIFNNELLDAFAVCLAQWDDSAQKWQEVWLNHQANGPSEEELRPLGLPAREHSALGSWPAKTLMDGQRCELHEDVRAWLHGWMPAWRWGSMLCIDYGDLFPTLYHRRRAGTLRGYLLQQRIEGSDIYQNVGRQDITCDVNFTDVRNWLTGFGCVETSYETQAEFLAKWAAKQSRKPGSAEEFLSLNEGAGGAFKCLAVRHHR